jgi:hypothetical protein
VGAYHRALRLFDLDQLVHASVIGAPANVAAHETSHDPASERHFSEGVRP